MKVETPQILWHSEESKGVNAALTSISLLQSGLEERNHVLATAANDNAVHLWMLSTTATTAATTAVAAAGLSTAACPSPSAATIEFRCSLQRHDGPVGAVAFSPDGLHLATAGETGMVIIWSVPVSKRGNGNGHHFWSQVTAEKDLQVKLIPVAADGLPDLSWSADSRRLMAGSVDHSVIVLEVESPPTSSASGIMTANTASASSWRVLYKNGVDHSHYVQGVAYDPSGVYLASMSSDRSVRLFTRRAPPVTKKNRQPTMDVADFLLYHKWEVQARSKEIRKVAGGWTFCDEATLCSFVRRLAWTVDGAYLIIPAATDGQRHACLLFARHHFEEPCRVFTGMEKPAVAVCPNHILFTLPTTHLFGDNGEKENQPPNPLPYRHVIAVLTWDAVLIYDTHHPHPLAIIRNIHYANLVDATWSSDGHSLLVCSTDGYISIIQFAPGEMGTVYQPHPQGQQRQVGALTASMPQQQDYQQQQQEQQSMTTPLHTSQSNNNRLGEPPPSAVSSSSTTTTTTTGSPVSVTSSSTTASPTVAATTPLRGGIVSSSASIRTTSATTPIVPTTTTTITLIPPCEPGPVAVRDDRPTKKKRIQPVLLSTMMS